MAYNYNRYTCSICGRSDILSLSGLIRHQNAIHPTFADADSDAASGTDNSPSPLPDDGPHPPNDFDFGEVADEDEDDIDKHEHAIDEDEDDFDKDEYDFELDVQGDGNTDEHNTSRDRVYHPILDGTPCNVHGQDLPPNTPPPPQDNRPNDWNPFGDRIGYELTDFCFTKAQMSKGRIDQLFQIMAALCLMISRGDQEK
ncbi:hypothetical protein OF83DRAFT_1178458, partial [Amylostereum chailletii]